VGISVYISVIRLKQSTVEIVIQTMVTFYKLNVYLIVEIKAVFLNFNLIFSFQPTCLNNTSIILHMSHYSSSQIVYQYPKILDNLTPMFT